MNKIIETDLMNYKFICLNTRTIKKNKIQETGDTVQIVKYLLAHMKTKVQMPCIHIKIKV